MAVSMLAHSYREKRIQNKTETEDKLFMQSWWSKTFKEILLQKLKWIILKYNSYSNEVGQYKTLLEKDIPFCVGDNLLDPCCGTTSKKWDEFLI